MGIQEKIVIYIKSREQVTAKEIAEHFNITKQALYKHLPKLIEKGLITKVGAAPRVFYLLKQPDEKKQELAIESSIKKVIDEKFLIITPAGEKKEGWEGFVYWCEKNKLPPVKTAGEYLKTIKKYNYFRKDDFIDGSIKIKNTFKEVFLDKVYYLDFYSIERFGKTKLGQFLLYAKQSQDKAMIKELIGGVKTKVDILIKKYKIDGIGYIPPTVKREVQFMKVLEQNLNKDIRKISIVKVKTPIIIPQKTLSKLEDRIENARNTIVVDDNSAFKNILLIDDAVGSGATLNETARKIRMRKICKGKIIGLAITGSFKGFDVISEV